MLPPACHLVLDLQVPTIEQEDYQLQAHQHVSAVSEHLPLHDMQIRNAAMYSNQVNKGHGAVSDGTCKGGDFIVTIKKLTPNFLSPSQPQFWPFLVLRPGLHLELLSHATKRKGGVM